MKLLWEDRAWEEYLEWQAQDRKTLNQINSLVKDTMRHPFEGIGKPEPLRGNLSGLWSRRIDRSNRLVYRVTDNAVEIIQCRSHYDE